MERSSTSRRSGRTLQKYWPALLLLAVLLIAGSIGGVLLAKYITTNRQQVAMVSAGFHMSSDLLETTEASNLGGVEDIVIELYNFEKENNAQISAVDITYTITVTNGTVTSVMNGSNDVSYTESSSVRYYALAGGNGKVTHTITVQPDHTGNVNVRVDSTAPFTKSLSGTFSYQAPQYKIEQDSLNSNLYILTVYSNGYDGSLTISMGSGVIADRTVDLQQGWTRSSETLAVNAKSTYVLKFISTSNITQSLSDVIASTITVGS